jgi:hypothetical protein
MTSVFVLDNRMNPDCVAGSHKACRGDAWSIEDDRACDCECSCHIDVQEAAA